YRSGDWSGCNPTCTGSNKTLGRATNRDHIDFIYSLCIVWTSNAWNTGAPWPDDESTDKNDVFFYLWYIRNDVGGLGEIYFPVLIVRGISNPNEYWEVFQ